MLHLMIVGWLIGWMGLSSKLEWRLYIIRDALRVFWRYAIKIYVLYIEDGCIDDDLFAKLSN